MSRTTGHDISGEILLGIFRAVYGDLQVFRNTSTMTTGPGGPSDYDYDDDDETDDDYMSREEYRMLNMAIANSIETMPEFDFTSRNEKNCVKRFQPNGRRGRKWNLWGMPGELCVGQYGGGVTVPAFVPFGMHPQLGSASSQVSGLPSGHSKQLKNNQLNFFNFSSSFAQIGDVFRVKAEVGALDDFPLQPLVGHFFPVGAHGPGVVPDQNFVN